MSHFQNDLLVALAERYYHAPCINMEKLAQSGSVRLYFRLFFSEKPTLIGVFNEDVAENRAFFAFTHFFESQGIHVPHIFSIHDNEQYYIINDLGNETLFSYLSAHRNGPELDQNTINYYKKIICQLPLLQMSVRKGMDLSVAYPRDAFDRQSMQWDLNYFKYYFVKLSGISFDEQKLEDDFQRLIQKLLSCDTDFFLYRDFQSRNIMIHEEEVYFIDYQGGRKGSYHYDIASLLFDGKADIPFATREELLDFYLSELQKQTIVNKNKFREEFYSFALIRIMQAMGAYGYRGYFERKSHFLQSIPFAMTNIRYLLAESRLPDDIPYLKNILQQLTEVDWTYMTGGTAPSKNDAQLHVLVQSFSFKKGVPADPSENGGGFVFDCRFLPNPGREAKYRLYSGKDRCVKEYLEAYEEVALFKQHVNSIMDMAVKNYRERHFTHLMISFGCTGGQHRSAYFAECAAQYLQDKYPDVSVQLRHRDCPC